MKTYSYIISQTANDNLVAIDTYISQTLHNPKAAGDFFKKFKKVMDMVCVAPKGFASCYREALRKQGVRLVHVNDYKVYYIIHDESMQIEVLFIRHRLQNI